MLILPPSFPPSLTPYPPVHVWDLSPPSSLSLPLSSPSSSRRRLSLHASHPPSLPPSSSEPPLLFPRLRRYKVPALPKSSGGTEGKEGGRAGGKEMMVLRAERWMLTHLALPPPLPPSLLHPGGTCVALTTLSLFSSYLYPSRSFLGVSRVRDQQPSLPPSLPPSLISCFCVLIPPSLPPSFPPLLERRSLCARRRLVLPPPHQGGGREGGREGGRVAFLPG